MTPAIPLHSRTWTLRFKNQRSTVLLHVDPLQQLSSVRAELLIALQQTHPDGMLHGQRLPDTDEDILLARPADIHDLTLGWDPLARDEALENALAEESNSTGKGKGKAGASGKAKSAKDKLSDCPQGAGLRDGGVVAFKFKSQAAAERDEGIEVDEHDGLDNDMLVSAPDKERWDVVVPTMEETYGDGEAGMGNLEDDIDVPMPTNAT
ncbi:hypothetical protein B0A50_01752 [Salinomyces thailandicus]|uniref:Uncharacterized protein n=1 Tax=Salinomyces thailandicus TaxID=706561 RepID=A0A4U0U983_9PEZI|nr:hypothetical protein B0A50_01752 [Salinomyces thailandica]